MLYLYLKRGIVYQKRGILYLKMMNFAARDYYAFGVNWERGYFGLAGGPSPESCHFRGPQQGV